MKNKKLLLSIIIFSTILTTFSFYFYQVFFSPNFLINDPEKKIYIDNSTTFKELQNTLHNKGYINDLVSFSFLAKIMKYNMNIKPGAYVIESNMSNYALIQKLRSGDQTPINITFSYARRIEDLAPIITNKLKIDEDEFMNYIKLNENNLYGFDRNNILSMFLPDTYQVYWNITVKELFERMYKEHSKFWNNKRKDKLKKLGLEIIDFSTLASIVSSETNNIDEAKKIAGVYINRLRNNMLLAADPTLVYAANDYSIKRVLNKHKKIKSPYNTYINKGLPPGPIKMSSKKMIDATLDYKNHDFFFFCLKDDFSGYHVFATKLSEHNRNAKKLHRALNKRKIYQ